MVYSSSHYWPSLSRLENLRWHRQFGFGLSCINYFPPFALVHVKFSYHTSVNLCGGCCSVVVCCLNSVSRQGHCLITSLKPTSFVVIRSVSQWPGGSSLLAELFEPILFGFLLFLLTGPLSDCCQAGTDPSPDASGQSRTSLQVSSALLQRLHEMIRQPLGIVLLRSIRIVRAPGFLQRASPSGNTKYSFERSREKVASFYGCRESLPLHLFPPLYHYTHLFPPSRGAV